MIHAQFFGQVYKGEDDSIASQSIVDVLSLARSIVDGHNVVVHTPPQSGKTPDKGTKTGPRIDKTHRPAVADLARGRLPPISRRPDWHV